MQKKKMPAIHKQDICWLNYHQLKHSKVFPIPHTELRIIPRVDDSLLHLQIESKRRRDRKPVTKNILSRQYPIPNILESYEPKAVTTFEMKNGGRVVLPYPSILRKPLPASPTKLEERPPSCQSIKK
jgi:hypothetical protein